MTNKNMFDIEEFRIKSIEPISKSEFNRMLMAQRESKFYYRFKANIGPTREVGRIGITPVGIESYAMYQLFRFRRELLEALDWRILLLEDSHAKEAQLKEGELEL